MKKGVDLSDLPLCMFQTPFFPRTGHCGLRVSTRGSTGGTLFTMHLGLFLEPQTVQCTRCRLEPLDGPESPGANARSDVGVVAV